MKAELLTVVKVSNSLGEGVLWNERQQAVWWTDINAALLYRYHVESGVLDVWDTPHRVACFGFIKDSDKLIVAFDIGLAIYDVTGKQVDWLVPPGFLAEGVRFNDGKVDPAGRFWVGTMVESLPALPGSAALFCYDPVAGLSEMISQITISNGLCWSPDGKIMYHADSPENTIYSYSIDKTGPTLDSRREFAKTETSVHPDGSTIDAAGGILNAQWGGSRVVRYAPNGETDLVIDVPALQPTCVAFGGSDLSLLFVTSAREGLSDEDVLKQCESGNLFIFRTDFKGLRAFEFRM